MDVSSYRLLDAANIWPNDVFLFWVPNAYNAIQCCDSHIPRMTVAIIQMITTPDPTITALDDLGERYSMA